MVLQHVAHITCGSTEPTLTLTTASTTLSAASVATLATLPPVSDTAVIASAIDGLAVSRCTKRGDEGCSRARSIGGGHKSGARSGQIDARVRQNAIYGKLCLVAQTSTEPAMAHCTSVCGSS